MQTHSNRVRRYAGLSLICLLNLMAFSGCEKQPAAAVSTPTTSTGELKPIPPAFQPPAADVRGADDNADNELTPTPLATEEPVTPTLDAEAHIYQELLPTPQVRFNFIPHGDDVQLSAALENEQRSIIEIVNPSGVGSADVEIVSEKLPPKIVLQFYLHGLERLRLTYNRTIVEVSVSKTEAINVSESVARVDEPGSSRPIASDSPYWMKVRLVPNDGSAATIPLANGYFEVEVPPSFLADGNHRFSIEWIDFYR